MIPSLFDLHYVLSSRRYRFTTERELGDGITELLTQYGIPFEREAIVADTDRIDFLVGRIGVELKTKGSPSAVAAQLLRYAQNSAFDGLILVTSRTQLSRLPDTLHGKPLWIVNLSGAGL